MKLLQLRSLGAALSAVVLLTAAQPSLATNITGTFQQATDVTVPYTPTYAAPANDALLGLTPTTISPSETPFDVEASGGTPVLTDGVFGPIGLPSGATHPSFAAADAGQSLTYTLLSPITLTSIVTLGGWNDNGRDVQSYDVSYITGSGTTFLTTVDYDPNAHGAVTATQTATQVVIDGFGSIPGVTGIFFSFNTAANGYQGYAELAAVGVPEPASLALFGLGAVGLVAVARRRRAA